MILISFSCKEYAYIKSLCDDSPSLLYFTNLEGCSHLQHLALSFFSTTCSAIILVTSMLRMVQTKVRLAIGPHSTGHRGQVAWIRIPTLTPINLSVLHA